MAKNNERNTQENLLRLMQANFETGDSFATLTFRPEDRPDAMEAVKRIFDIFIRRMRARYRKLSIELKWIMAVEFMNKYIHFHIILNDVPEFNRIIRECWTWGGVNVSPLWEDGNYSQLADYMLKETSKTAKMKSTPFSQRYGRSKRMLAAD